MSQNTEDVEKLALQVAVNAFFENVKSRGAFPQVAIDRIGRLSR
jgi:hypothetical protein